MNVEELAKILDQIGCVHTSVGVGKAIHDMIKEELGVNKNWVNPGYYGRKYYQVQELKPDEIILQIKQMPDCIVSYSRLLEINLILSSLMIGAKPVTSYKNPALTQKDNLDMLLTLDEDFKHGKLTVIRE